MYQVIEFNDGILAVPVNWIDNNKQMCKWPPYSNEDVEEAIKDADEPKDDWKELHIKNLFGKPVGK